MNKNLDKELQVLLDERKKLFIKFTKKEITKERYELLLDEYSNKINIRQRELAQGVSKKPLHVEDSHIISIYKDIGQLTIFMEKVKKMKELKKDKISRKNSITRLVLKALENAENKNIDDVVKEVMSTPNRTNLVEERVRLYTKHLLYQIKMFNRISLMEDNFHVVIKNKDGKTLENFDEKPQIS